MATTLPSLSPTAIPWEKRMEVVGRYMLLGNLRVVSEQCDVSYPTLLDWKKSEWWPEIVQQIKRQKRNRTNDSITKIIENSLEIMQDRLENGDFVLNNKTGEIIRKPVSIKDATAISSQLLQRQIQIEELEQKNEKSNDTVQETLTLLAKEFQKWSKKLPHVEIVEDNNYAVHDQRTTFSSNEGN